MRISLVACLLLIAGCGSAPEPPPGTGARETATEFFEALARRDWNAAYAKVAAESKKQTDAASFEKRAERYVRGLGFDFAKTHLRTCDEQGDQAIAHLNLSNAAGHRRHSYRESIALRKEPEGWGVILPVHFGRR